MLSSYRIITSALSSSSTIPLTEPLPETVSISIVDPIEPLLKYIGDSYSALPYLVSQFREAVRQPAIQDSLANSVPPRDYLSSRSRAGTNIYFESLGTFYRSKIERTAEDEKCLFICWIE